MCASGCPCVWRNERPDPPEPRQRSAPEFARLRSQACARSGLTARRLFQSFWKHQPILQRESEIIDNCKWIACKVYGEQALDELAQGQPFAERECE